MPKLIKDFKNYQIVFYWYEKGKGRQSPLMPTLNHAEEWLQQWGNAQYQGTERRRRSGNMSFSRRSTDKRICVDVDLCEKKLAELKHSFAA